MRIYFYFKYFSSGSDFATFWEFYFFKELSLLEEKSAGSSFLWVKNHGIQYLSFYYPPLPLLKGASIYGVDWILQIERIKHSYILYIVESVN